MSHDFAIVTGKLPSDSP